MGLAPEKKKVLIFRLSSLGDVVLSSVALQTQALREASVEWVVSSEYADLLVGHPRLKRVWKYDRSTGLFAWIRLCRRLSKEEFDLVLDLHSTIRTFLARWVFKLTARRFPEWRRIRKPRIDLYRYFLKKGRTPRRKRPGSWVTRFAHLAGGDGSERPDLSFLLKGEKILPGQEYVCVMPASLWRGKEWPVHHFAEVISKSGLFPVVLGTSKDRASQDLVSLLEARGVEHLNGVDRWSLKELPQVLAGARSYFGGDTGISHLAEAIGTPSWVVFGPTVPDMGFGPWRDESLAIESPLWCRPCGKDGRYCFRVWSRYECQQVLRPSQVLREISSQNMGRSKELSV